MDETVYTMSISPEEVISETPKVESNRPEWLPEKFNDPLELVKSYNELEKKLGSQTSQPSGNPMEIPKPSQASSFSFDKYQEEVQTKGALSEESYLELAQKGLSKDFVDSYISGQKALAERSTRAAYDVVGGPEVYNNLVQWAAANLSPAEVDAFNQSLKGNPAQIAFAVEGLAARYQRMNGSQPQGLLQGKASVATQTHGFNSNAEIVAAMSDPRYMSDPHYRKQVEAKLAASL
jgi:hypothetical protein